jgi:beta,beta-carotene 9',10'-dioxygenase
MAAWVTGPSLPTPRAAGRPGSGDYLFPNPGDNGLVSLIRHRGELLALTESTPQLRVDPVNLSVTGRMQYRDSLVGHLTTAHPHIDANRGEVVNLLTRFGKVSSYQFYRMPLGGDRREIIGTLPASEPSYNHSFGMTASHIILIEYPFVVKPLQLLFGSTTILGSYVWKPELGTRIRVIERGTGSARANLPGRAALRLPPCQRLPPGSRADRRCLGE